MNVGIMMGDYVMKGGVPSRGKSRGKEHGKIKDYSVK